MQLNLFSSGEPKKENSSNIVWKIYTDGASRNNPGPSGAGIYIEKNGESFLKKAFFLGKKTNNEAEYLALLIGLFILKDFYKDGDKLEIYADSQLLINQLNGSYKVKIEHLKKLRSAIIEILFDFDYNLTHIYRDLNSVADELSNQAIDKKIQLGDDMISKLAKYEIYL